MPLFGASFDDFYVNLTVNTEMELIQGRESVLHFFEQTKKRFPSMGNFYSREKNEFVLEEDKELGAYRWAAVESKRFCSGFVNPPELEDAVKQHETLLELAPFALSLSPLDCESINLMYGFDFSYRGNHDALVAEALGLPPAFESIAQEISGKTVADEPACPFALDDDCRLQCRVSIETRTSAFHVRSGCFPDEQISVYVTARRYGSLPPDQSFVDVLRKLDTTCRDVVDNYVTERVLVPLHQTIAMK